MKKGWSPATTIYWLVPGRAFGHKHLLQKLLSSQKSANHLHLQTFHYMLSEYLWTSDKHTGICENDWEQRLDSRVVNQNTGRESSWYLIGSNDSLYGQMIIDLLGISDGLRHCTSCRDGCHGHRPRPKCSCLAAGADCRRRHVCRARWCTVASIAKEHIPRLSTNKDIGIILQKFIKFICMPQRIFQDHKNLMAAYEFVYWPEPGNRT